MRGKLGFADSFLHGRLGALVLKQLSEHAYSGRCRLPHELVVFCKMRSRLIAGKPRVIISGRLQQWFVYTDASYLQDDKTGGVGAGIFNAEAECVSWFGIPLDGPFHV